MPVLLYVVPLEAYVPLKTSYLLLNVLLAFYWFKYVRINGELIIFSIFWLILGLITYFVKGYHWANAVIPITSYFAYYYISKIKYNFKVFDYVMIGLYIFFFFSYYALLPSLFLRRISDLDANTFGDASSNAIAISLNILLYIYIILSYYQGVRNDKKIIIFAIINFVLIIIQQSRIGVIVAMVNIVIYPLIIEKKVTKKMKTIIFLGLIFFVIAYRFAGDYMEVAGDFGLGGYSDDTRGKMQAAFIANMNSSELFWGYPINHVYYGVQTRTFNVFFRIWNFYTIIGFILIVFTFIFRFVNYKKYYFPLLLFLPFLLYSMVEEFFFPDLWDFSILLLLFVKKNNHRKTNSQMSDNF